LEEAIAACKKHKARLIIAKLDRLSRNLAFIATMMECKVKFVCCDAPEADETMLHFMGVMAHWERRQISQRTREALAAAKARGVVIGNYQRIARAKQEATTVRAMITETMHLWLQGAADELNRRGLTTAGGKPCHAMQISRARQRLGLVEAAPAV
jgi:DNA invertase Pin-like site-specific DNA recombinase